MTLVKICGITNVDDALWAAEQGADAIGFIFASSPRQVSEELARAIRRRLPPFVSAVGVFVDPDPRRTRETCENVGLDFIQLYRSNDGGFLQESKLNPARLIRAISVGCEADLKAIRDARAGTILLDTKVEGKVGGTGKTFDWNLASKAKTYGKPIILSGGLNPANVGEAIEIAAPEAVDVSSGVESAPGKKDPEKVREFIRRTKAYVT